MGRCMDSDADRPFDSIPHGESAPGMIVFFGIIGEIGAASFGSPLAAVIVAATSGLAWKIAT